MTATGCEDFLDRPQLDKVQDNDSFWRNETDFRTYSVDFYTWFFTGYNSGYGVNYTPLTGYTFNDDLSSSSKQENFVSNVPGSVGNSYTPSGLAGGSWYRQYSGETWNFGWVRKANIMIQRVDQYKKNLVVGNSDAAYRHWMAVARFFRAYAYYNLVVSFGDVPYFDKPVDETNLPEMFKDRDNRQVVMDHIYDDLKYAIDNSYLLDNGSSQYVNKYVIASIASRIMLFEGTWEKYHKVKSIDNVDRVEKYLKFCVEAADVVKNSNKYKCARDFRSLFGSPDLKGHPEVIFYRNYTATMTTHSVASYANGYEGQGKAANLQLIKAFVCNDGQPYKTSSLANANDFKLSELAKTRDPRFEATFFCFPEKKSATLLYSDKFISREGASFWDKDGIRPSQYGGAVNENDAPVIRYAEILLNWIEAKAELAQTYGGSYTCSQTDINESINQIRKRPLDPDAERAGVHQTAPLDISMIPNDPDRDSDVSPLLWEIRRERRMEFVFEFPRLLDIKRWAKISYMDNIKYPDTMFGTWVDFNNDSDVKAWLDDPQYTKPNGPKLIVRTADGTEITYDKTNRDKMVGFFKLINVQPRDPFTDRVYLSPVGVQEIQEYKAKGFTLTQTQGW